MQLAKLFRGTSDRIGRPIIMTLILRKMLEDIKDTLTQEIMIQKLRTKVVINISMMSVQYRLMSRRNGKKTVV